MKDNSRPNLRSLPLLKPTYTRYRYLASKIRQHSLTRALQYEIFERYPLHGDVLDFGGGEKSQYREILQCNTYKSVNIDSNIEPTWLTQVGEPLLCGTGSFDTVISLNTLEHIFDAQSVLEELYRVLRPGGELLLTVPFLFPIHGHPDDFFRPTPSWYRQALGICGFSEVDVIPLCWGPFTTASTCSGLPGPAKGMRKQIALVLDLLYSQINQKRKPAAALQAQHEQFATAFLVRALK